MTDHKPRQPRSDYFSAINEIIEGAKRLRSVFDDECHAGFNPEESPADSSLSAAIHVWTICRASQERADQQKAAVERDKMLAMLFRQGHTVQITPDQPTETP